MTWRDSCRPLIAKTIKENEGKSLKEIKKALREVYPWGQRAMHPYKIWCDEVKVQLGLKKKKIKGHTINKNQLELL
jgi:hypothetical protein